MTDESGDVPEEAVLRAARIAEAFVFASTEPVSEEDLADRLPDGAPLERVLASVRESYASRGVNLVRVGGRWAFRTAPDLAAHLRIERPVRRKLTRAMTETLAVIAYHQPVTRAEIEEIRGVALSRGTLDALLESEWVAPGRRRRVPGKPVTWLTTVRFLEHFGLESLDDLPGLADLKSAGLLDERPASTILGETAEAPALEDEDERQAALLLDRARIREEEEETLEDEGGGLP